MTDYAGRYLRHPQPSRIGQLFNAIFPRMPFNDLGIFGFDISKWQDIDATPQGIDFAKMRNYGASFVIVKTGQGAAADQDFVRNWQDAKAAGIPRGSYWFYDPRYSPQSQAAKWWSLIKNDLPEGRLWLDLEHPASWGGSFGTWQSWKIMLDEIKRLSGLRIGIYTGYYYWKDKTVGADLNYFKQYALWLAWYTPSYFNVSVPAPWTAVTLWQNGTPAIGYAAGVESLEIDYNKFNGTQEQFTTEFGGLAQPPPPPPPPTGDTMLQCKTRVQVKVFNAINGTQTRLIGANVTFNALELVGDWLKLPTGEYVNIYKGGELAVDVTPIAPPPPPPTKVLTNVIEVFNDGSIIVTPK